MVFCNKTTQKEKHIMKDVTILILIDGFLQSRCEIGNYNRIEVTILILIDGFLQFIKQVIE